MTVLAERLSAKRVVICAGAGGVGKTTMSAVVALGLAARGARVAVVTIDPARRLAEALGLDELGNHPQPVASERFTRAGLEVEGELSAMMLDVKSTFDELIALLAGSAPTREAILANPVYQHLSTAVAGSQEYTAIAKLYELAMQREFDVIVLDTPPSRSAIDFLQAPERLIGFLDGGAATALLRPAGPALRAAGFMLAGLGRITGSTLLDDLRTFFGLMSELLEGFRRRAAGVHELLRDPATAFVVVTSPERAALEEAIRFAAELDRVGMHRSAVIVNRVQPLDPAGAETPATVARLAPALGARLARTVARTHADLQALARRDQAALSRLRRALDDPDPVCLADREADVHDVKVLIDLHNELFT